MADDIVNIALTATGESINHALTASGEEVSHVLTPAGETVSLVTIFTVTAPEPTVQPSNLLFSDITIDGMTLSWTAGDGSDTIWLRSTSPITDVPVDLTNYSVGDMIGASTVAYFGTAETFIETGLDSATRYYYAGFSVNGASGTWNYLTTSPETGDEMTDSAFSFGNCIKLDGTNDYGLYTETDIGTVFSLEFWIKTTDTSAIWWSRNAGGGNEFLGITTSGQVRFKYGAGSVEVNTTGMGALHDGTWRHFALTRNAATFRFYLDGVNVGGNKTGNTFTAAFGQIGAYQDGHLLPFNGFLDEFRFYGNYLMTDAEVLAQFNSGLGAAPLTKTPHASDIFLALNEVNSATTAPDTSGNGNTLTWYNLNFDANSGWFAH